MGTKLKIQILHRHLKAEQEKRGDIRILTVAYGRDIGGQAHPGVQH